MLALPVNAPTKLVDVTEDNPATVVMVVPDVNVVEPSVGAVYAVGVNPKAVVTSPLVKDTVPVLVLKERTPVFLKLIALFVSG